MSKPIKIRHQLIFHGKDGGEKVLIESFMEWDITEEDLETARTQLGIMEWEEENLIKPFIEVKRARPESDEEWEKLIKESKDER